MASRSLLLALSLLLACGRQASPDLFFGMWEGVASGDVIEITNDKGQYILRSAGGTAVVLELRDGVLRGSGMTGDAVYVPATGHLFWGGQEFRRRNETHDTEWVGNWRCADQEMRIGPSKDKNWLTVAWPGNGPGVLSRQFVGQAGRSPSDGQFMIVYMDKDNHSVSMAQRTPGQIKIYSYESGQPALLVTCDKRQ